MSSRPDIIFWRIGGSDIVLRSLPNRHDLPRRVAKPWIPYGVIAFRLRMGDDWTPIGEIPPEWKMTGSDGAPFTDSELDAGTHETQQFVRDRAEEVWRKRQKASERKGLFDNA